MPLLIRYKYTTRSKGGSKIIQNTEKPLIGFFPFFYSIGETIPLVKIAKLYMESGGRTIFFSHGGRYENLAEKIGCKIIKLSDILDGAGKEKCINMWKKGAPLEKVTFGVYIKEFIGRAVEEEIKSFNETGIKVVISAYNLTTSISARALKIPLITIVSGTCMPPYFKSGFATFPENYENLFTKFVPSSLKNQIARWILLNNKLLVKDFNKVAKKYKVKTFKHLTDLFLGDYTFVCDDINFLGVKSSEDFPLENYIGPIVGGGLFEEEQKEIDADIQNHLKKPGQSILLMMGGTGNKKLFLKILETLNKTNYKVIAVYTKILKKEELPETNENILLKQFLPSPLKVNKMVDLAIIHGGRGTVYTAAYSGKPAIGIPLFIEHQYNIDNLVRNGSAIRLSEKYFNTRELLEAINNIFSDYDKFLTNAQKTATKLAQEAGEKKAVSRILEIIQSNREKIDIM